MKRVAVAVDFSTYSELALREGLAVARRIGAEVHMIHVCELHTGYASEAEVAEYNEAERKSAREQLAELHDRYDGQGAPIYQVLTDGKTADALCQAATELGCELMVIGTHGRTGVRRFFLGSVAEKVARMATMDVLVARGTPARDGYHRILVPTDFSAPANRALERAVAVAADGADIDLFHVWRLPGQLSMQYATAGAHKAAVIRIATRIRDEASERAAEEIARYADANVTITFNDQHGSEGRAIIDRAPGFDLVAIGTHGRRGLERFALGSIAERTIRHAPCSVLATHAAAISEPS